MNIHASFYKKSQFMGIILLFMFISLLNQVSTQTVCDYNICQCQNSTCISCLDSSFYYNSTVKTCYLCPPQCLTCSPEQQCLTCREMFYYSNFDQQCYKCPKYCKTCTILSNSTLLTCSQCITGYVLIGSACQKCQVQNVQSCQSSMTVKTCLSKFWKNGDSCSPCRQFCVFCTSSNNCLKCQDGYRTKVSAGTFCVACDIGCKTCTDTSCSECFFNYRLINGKCQPIDSNCSLIANCQKCQYSATSTPLMVKCLLCDYPYYLNSNGTCTKGSSILCNYANAQNSYQCLNECTDFGYKIKTVSTTSNKNVDQIMCLPRLWIQNTAIQQIYFNSLFARRYLNIFSPITNWTILCGSQYLTTGLYQSLSNNLNFLYVFEPFYKLVFHIKYLPAFRSANNVSDLVLNSSSYNIGFSISMTDNSSNSYSYQQILPKDNLLSCQQEYISISSKNIKDQKVSIQFKTQFLNSTSPLSNLISTDQLLLSNFPSGILSYKQILIQIYRCDSKCRICSNTKYCLECYPPLFLSTYVCVQSCEGLFQFYLPYGNYVNYTSKYCVQDCEKGYYSTNHPLKNGTFICLKCPQKCKTCRSATECLSCNQPWLFYSTNFSCIASCPDTHYPNNISLECTPCNAPCKTCKSQTQCLTCSIGYFDGKNCVGICPQSTYSTSTSHQCLPCDSKCLICQNTPTYCSACQSNYKLLGSICLSSCPLNTHYQYNGVCLACKSPCTLCASQTVCITCSRGYLFNSSCLSECPSGYYKDIGNSRCNICQNNCKTCISQSICKTCVNGTYLYNSMCLVECPIKTYINSNGVCIPCIPPCLTCFDQSKCLTCSIGYLSLIQNFTCLTDCQPGYFGYSSNQTCIKCSSQCLTCKQEADFCLSCPLNKLLEKNQCVSNCSLGYFSFNNQKCRPCSYPCLTCIDISSKCLTCQSPYILLGDYKCALQCLSTQYKKNGTCLNCAYPCSSCTQINACTSCVRANSTANQTYLYFNNCLQYCPDGMYKDPISLKCKDCIFPCLNCLSSRQCLSCISGYLNTQKKSCQICSSYYYPDDSTKTCKLCSSVLLNCQQCLSSTVCKVCYSGFYLFNNTCVSADDCSLKSGYYINYQTKKCSQCVPPCKDCVNATYCKNCINGYYFEGKCRFTCLQGYFANFTSNICQQCNYSVCLSCQNSANQCLSCNQTSLLNVLFPQNQTCINQGDCGMMYYLDSSYGYKRCLKCISPCKTCTNSSYCTSCVAGVLYKGSCSFSCPNKFFAQDQNSTLGIIGNVLTVTMCQQCSSMCLQCSSNDTNCISCPTSKFLQNGSCVDKCSPTFYLNQYIFQCIKCQSPCVLCDSATYCLSCQNSSKILYYGQCIDQCPEGTYINKAQCITCPQQCQICQYSVAKADVICKKCSSGLYMNSTNEGVCQSTCKTNEYPDSQTRKCYPCQIPCLQCLTATKCKSCISQYLLYSNNQCLKGTQCQKGTFQDPQISGKCLQLCYQPYYGDYLTLKCNQTCSNKNLKIIYGPQRICDEKCPDNYYVDNGFVCNQCQNNICDDILRYQVYPKSIFNKLYLKVKFSKDVLTALIDQKDIKILITQLQEFTNTQSNRRLQSTSSNSSLSSTYNFTITQRSPRALWLQIHTYQTLKKISIKVHFSSYYLFSPTSNPSPSTNLQNLNTSVLVQRFDQYTSDQQQQGKSFQKFSIFLSILTLLIIIISMVLNSLSLFYKLIDYFQLLFLLIFLQIDYPPILNYFFYGFRYAHYLFLPQIFRPTDNSQKQEYSQTPGKFGIIVPDADFLTNTGHDFLIIFIAIGVVIIVKIIDFLLSGRIKNNKVSNDPNEEKEHKDNSIKDNNQIQSGVGIAVHNKKQKSEDYNAQNTPDDNQLNKIKTHNKIQLQILQGKHGKLAKYSKVFISRLKWNYFNDISYCLYFYIALFSYSQTYILSQTKFISNMFAFIGFAFTLGLPIFFIYLLNNNKQQILQSTLQSQDKTNPHLPFKTFYYFLIPDSSYTLYTIPIRYVQKLIFAILLVFCSEFPQFVLGIILMTTILTMILNYLYKPFLLTIQLYIQLSIDLLFVIIIFLLCVVELDYLMLETASKLTIAKLIVAITVVMTLGLVFWNVIRLIVEVIKACGGKDYFQNYYRETEDFEGLKSQVAQLTEKRKSQKSRVSIAAGLAQQIHSNNNGLDQQSNVRLHPGFMSPKQHQATSSVNFNSRLSQDQYSGLDIYLKKQANAPPMLIKCIKDFQGQQQDHFQQDDDDDEEQQNESSKSKSKRSQQQSQQPKQSSSQSHSQSLSSSPNKNRYINNQPQYQQNSQSNYSQNNYKKASIYNNKANNNKQLIPKQQKSKPIFPQNGKNVVLNFEQQQQEQQKSQKQHSKQSKSQQSQSESHEGISQNTETNNIAISKKQQQPNKTTSNNNKNLTNIQTDPFIQFQQFDNKNIFQNSQSQSQQPANTKNITNKNNQNNKKTLQNNNKQSKSIIKSSTNNNLQQQQQQQQKQKQQQNKQQKYDEQQYQQTQSYKNNRMIHNNNNNRNKKMKTIIQVQDFDRDQQQQQQQDKQSQDQGKQQYQQTKQDKLQNQPQQQDQYHQQTIQNKINTKQIHVSQISEQQQLQKKNQQNNIKNNKKLKNNFIITKKQQQPFYNKQKQQQK